MSNPSLPDIEAKYQYFRGKGLRVLAKAAGSYTKRPLGDGWQDKPSATLNHIRETYNKGLSDGLCLAMGPDDNDEWYYFAVDCDVKNKTQTNNANAIYQLGGETLIIETASRGYHLIYKIKADDPRIRKYDIATRKDVQPDIDIRAHGGQIVTAPSTMIYTGKEATDRHLPDGHVGAYTIYKDSAIAIATEDLLKFVGRGEEIAQRKEEAKIKRAKFAANNVSITQIKSMIDAVLPTLDRKPVEPWLDMIFAAHSGSGGSQEILGYILDHDATDHDWVRVQNLHKTWQSRDVNGGVSIGTLIKMAKDRGWDGVADETPGITGQNESSLEFALEELGIEIALDARWGDKIIWRRAGKQWQDLKDHVMMKMIRTISERYYFWSDAKTPKRIPLRYTPKVFREFLQAIGQPVDLFKEHLENLPEWDGTRRAARILTDLYGAADTPLNRWCSVMLFRFPIARTYDPGCAQHQLIILVGDEGIGKSFLLRALAIDKRFFRDQVNIGKSTKQLKERMAGKAVGELSEMAGTKKDLDAFKAYITADDDGGDRDAYKYNTYVALRLYALFGTSNEFNVVPDDVTGNRRFVPVLLNRSCNTMQEFIKSGLRDQCYAEVLHDYKQGQADGDENLISCLIPYELAAQAKIEAEVHRDSDPLQSDVEELLDTDCVYKASEIWTLLGNKGTPNQSESWRIGRIVRRIKDKNGKNLWVAKKIKIDGKQYKRFVTIDKPEGGYQFPDIPIEGSFNGSAF